MRLSRTVESFGYTVRGLKSIWREKERGYEMSEEAANAMNSLTVFEARKLNATCGMILIIGNAQVFKVTTPEDVTAEEERCVNGY